MSRVTLDKRIAGQKLSTHTDASGRLFLDPSELQRLFEARDGSTSNIAMLSAQDMKAAGEAIEIAEDAAQVAKQEVPSLRPDLDKANAENAGLLKAVALVEDMRKDRDSEMSRTLASHKNELAGERKPVPPGSVNVSIQKILSFMRFSGRATTFSEH